MNTEIRDTTGNILRPGMYGYEEALGLKEPKAQASQRDTPSLTSSELFDKVKASGVPFSNHESDLYVKRTPESVELIRNYQFRQNVQIFKNNIDGLTWYDVPFAYQPFWDRVRARSAASNLNISATNTATT